MTYKISIKLINNLSINKKSTENMKNSWNIKKYRKFINYLQDIEGIEKNRHNTTHRESFVTAQKKIIITCAERKTSRWPPLRFKTSHNVLFLDKNEFLRLMRRRCQNDTVDVTTCNVTGSEKKPKKKKQTKPIYPIFQIQ